MLPRNGDLGKEADLVKCVTGYRAVW
jgi:hypothetical protein